MSSLKAGFALPVLNKKARSEEFGYTCNGCMNCCYSMNVHVNPYESACLARRMGITTGQFRRKFTKAGKGTTLKERKKGGACVFLGEQGCTVYSDRPLVCRLYPLGREVTSKGKESFTHMEPHPNTAGIYSKNGAVAGFLAKHGVAPFIQAADEYFEWYNRAVHRLEQGSTAAGEAASIAASIPDLLDMDTAVAAYCSEKRIPEPTDVEERKTIHLLTLNDALTIHQKNDSGG